VFRVAAERARLIQRLHVDSAGTHGGHAGASPDPRATKTALARGYPISQLRARQVEPRDFERFAWIFAMDRENLHILSELCPPAFSGTLGLYLDLVPEIGLREVPDPYYGALEGFERVIDLAEAASEALVLRLSRELRG
jgi:protein-tyrosine phosphatase